MRLDINIVDFNYLFIEKRRNKHKDIAIIKGIDLQLRLIILKNEMDGRIIINL